MRGTGAWESTATDAALIARSLAEPDCFSLIVDRHATPVFRFVTSHVGAASAEDLLADVFESAFKARQRYDPGYENALPWLLGIATNVIRHHRRTEVRRASMVRRVTQLAANSRVPDASDTVVADVELNEEMHHLRRAIAALDEKHREVLVLSAGLGLSYDDIARALGIRVGTVRSRLSRARGRLRELLDTDGQYSQYAKSTGKSPPLGDPPT